MNLLAKQLNTVKKLWWLHDYYWHATVVRRSETG